GAPDSGGTPGAPAHRGNGRAGGLSRRTTAEPGQSAHRHHASSNSPKKSSHGLTSRMRWVQGSGRRSRTAPPLGPLVLHQWNAPAAKTCIVLRKKLEKALTIARMGSVAVGEG